jgi:PncC family amidohydrolase
VALAESCTGGMLGAMLTSAPGSSDYFLGGIVSYSNDVKERELGVDGVVLEREGTVSDTVARQMAAGVRRKFGCDIAVSITGIAGPDGGSADKPVGTVFVGWSTEEECSAKKLHIDGDRAKVRKQSCREALDLLKEVATRMAARG